MSNEATILLAEDDENDVALLRYAFTRANILNPLQVVGDGKRAIDYLKGNGRYSNRQNHPWPALMLLDLKMSPVDGFGVLAWWQRQIYASEIPIIVMSSSNSHADIQRALSLGAASYFLKSANMQYFVHVARQLRERWLTPAVSQSLPIDFDHATFPAASAHPRSVFQS